MAMTVRQLFAEARKLSSEEQAELLDLLLADARGGPDPKLDGAWRREIRRRLADIESGREKGISGDVVRAKARRFVGL